MGVLDGPGNFNRTSDWAAPRGCDGKLRRRMHGDPMWLHVTGNSHLLIGGVCNNVWRLRAPPAFDEIIARNVLEFVGQVTFNFGRRTAIDAKKDEPGRK